MRAKSTTDSHYHTKTGTGFLLYTRASHKVHFSGIDMPGMIFHMVVHATAGKPPVLAILNDAAPITGCTRWEETHDRRLVEPLWDFLRASGDEDIREAMENHLLVDESLHGPGTPLYPAILRREADLRSSALFQTPSPENRAKLAELIVETSLDGLTADANGSIMDLIAESRREWDIERVSRLFSRFFGRDAGMFRHGFGLLRGIDPRSITGIDGISRSWLTVCGTAADNLSRLEPDRAFQPWYDYLTRCFSSEEAMRGLREMESSARNELERIHTGIIAALDSRIKPQGA
jgi:hypothetical protein